MWNDFRYALRTLRQKPGFALTAIVSIALGIGANATIFSLADGLLLRPLPVPNASQVMTVSSRTPSGTFGSISYADFADLLDQTQSFNGLAAFDITSFGFAADAKAQSQLKVGYLASGNLFKVMGTEPQLGRGFRPEEDQVPGRDAVVVLGHDFWKNELGGDTSIIGRQVRLNGLDFVVIGVAPQAFTGLDQYIRPAFFVPAMMAGKLAVSSKDLLTNRSRREFMVKGRLKPGLSRQTADAEIGAQGKRLEELYPNTNRGYGAAVRTELQARTDFAIGDAAIVSLLFSIVLVALLIACANVANLMLSRGKARAREIAVRLALGASRARLIRQLMAESLLIALAGGVVGLLIAQFGVEALATVQVPSDIPIHLDFQLDARVLWFTVVMSVACAMIFGLAPAMQSTNTDLVATLKAGELSQARKRLFGGNALVVAQVAGSLVLLVAATQLFRGFGYLLAHSPGFRTDHLLMISFDPTLVRYSPEQTEQFYKTLTERAATVPGVKSVALTYAVPTGTTQRVQAVVPEGYQFPRGKETAEVLSTIVDANYFATLGVPMLTGRGFLSTDRADSPRVVVVNETFAKHYLGANPIGKRLRLKDAKAEWAEVVGVAVTGKYLSIIEPPQEFLYLPLSQQRQEKMTLIAESYGDPGALAGPLREMVRSIDSNLPLVSVRTMLDFFEQRSVKLMRMINGVVGLAGLLGLALALVGLYAVVAYQVARRTREIGIRMAIGADESRVMQMVLRGAVKMGLTGVAIGLALSYAGGRGLSAGLGLPSFDWVLFALVPVCLVATTVLAAAIPARRAARVDPMVALRQD